MECNILSPTKFDDVNIQFSKFLEQDLKRYHFEFEKFDQKCYQLDDCYFNVIQIQQYESLSFVIRLILTLSHGQTTVERCFSISNNILTQIMNTETVIARKVIKDQMISNKLDVATNEVNKSVLKAAGSASRKWRQALAGKQSEKKK